LSNILTGRAGKTVAERGEFPPSQPIGRRESLQRLTGSCDFAAVGCSVATNLLKRWEKFAWHADCGAFGRAGSLGVCPPEARRGDREAETVRRQLMDRWTKLAGGGALALTLLVGVTGQASAVIIDEWNFSTDNAFTEFDPDTVVGSSPNPVLGGATRIEWPVSFGSPNRSALEVEPASLGVFDGTVVTNGSAAEGPD